LQSSFLFNFPFRTCVYSILAFLSSIRQFLFFIIFSVLVFSLSWKQK
jgi:hypothetical protein